METNFDQNILLTQRVDPSFEEPIVNQTLRIAMYDEYHAYETYKLVIEKFGFVAPFANIMQAEEQHIQAMTHLLEKYQVSIPVNDWADRLEAPNTLQEAYELGVAAEIDNIKMYSHLLEHTIHPDIQDIFFRLQAASHNNHLPAFRSHVEGVISQNSSANLALTQEAMMEKVNEWSELAQKIASNQADPSDISKLLENTNLSFIGGMLLGGVGTSLLTGMNDQKQDDEEKE